MKFFNQKQLAITLLAVIAAPFVIFCFLLLASKYSTLVPVPPSMAMHNYGVLCISFFAGIQWGIHFCKRTEDSVYLLSFATLVMAWLSLLGPGTVWGLGVLLFAFVLSWLEEYRLSKQRVTTQWFWQVRCWSMLMIIVSLFLTIAVLATNDNPLFKQ
jgi:Protein of unknown function (DUF3429)